ncbi:hypothetical protein [Bremerella cremea]|uniref:hypothetical protein n=1 Tax=Bremerella cremea TaxID=1031537 RepID=UPI0031EA9B99
MNITSAIPLGIGAASLAAGAASQLSQGVFSLFNGTEAESDGGSTDQGSIASSTLEAFLSQAGELGAQKDELEQQLQRSLEELEGILRRTAHQAGQELPDAFQLSINADGEVALDSSDPLSQQTESLLSQSEEAQRILNQIAAQTATIKAASEQEAYAKQFNEDPIAAADALEKARSKQAELNVTFVGGEISGFQLGSV